MRRFITNRKTPASASNSWRKLSDTSAQSSKLRTPVRGYAVGCGGGSCVHFLMRSYTRLSPSRRFEICTLRMQARYRYSNSEHSNARLILPIYLGNGTGTVGAVCSQPGQTYWG